MADLTTDSHPTEYARTPVYDRVPSVEAIERMQQQHRLRHTEALKDELTAAVRATLRS